MFSILMEIYITFQRIFMISKSRKDPFMRKIRLKLVSSVILGASILMYTPVVFMQRVKHIEMRNETLNTVRHDYTVKKSEFGLTAQAVAVFNVLSVTRIILVFQVLLVVTVNDIHSQIHEVCAFLKFNLQTKKKHFSCLVNLL
jgi:hypothetical protein